MGGLIVVGVERKVEVVEERRENGVVRSLLKNRKTLNAALGGRESSG